MTRPLVRLVSTAILLVFVGCGRHQAGLVSPSFTNAQLLRANSGTAIWVLSSRGLQSANTTQVGPAQQLPASGGTIPSVAFADQTNGWLSASVSGSIRSYNTNDGGSTWTSAGSTSILGNEPVANVSISAIGQRIVVIANDQTSSNFSEAAAVVSGDGGKTWSTARAPVAGTVSVAGSDFWLVGGIQDNQVFTSTTGLVWTPVSLSVSGATWSAGAPVEITGSKIVLPLTIRDVNGATSISIRVSGDGGATWTQSASVSPNENTAVGIAVPVSINQDGTWETITTDGSKVYKGNVNQPGSAPAIVSPNGLAGDPIALEFSTGSQGVALTASNVCPSGKSSCGTSEELFGTSDGGQTWSAMTGQ